MSETRVASKTPTTKGSAPPPPDALEELLFTVEDRCNRAVAVLNATARAVEGEELGLHHDDVPCVFGAALERIAEELETLSDRALKARTAGKGGA
jgi:hypothetical protein